MPVPACRTPPTRRPVISDTAEPAFVDGAVTDDAQKVGASEPVVVEPADGLWRARLAKACTQYVGLGPAT